MDEAASDHAVTTIGANHRHIAGRATSDARRTIVAPDRRRAGRPAKARDTRQRKSPA
jgi:hypothetical protein